MQWPGDLEPLYFLTINRFGDQGYGAAAWYMPPADEDLGEVSGLPLSGEVTDVGFELSYVLIDPEPEVCPTQLTISYSGTFVSGTIEDGLFQIECQGGDYVSIEFTGEKQMNRCAYPATDDVLGQWSVALDWAWLIQNSAEGVSVEIDSKTYEGFLYYGMLMAINSEDDSEAVAVLFYDDEQAEAFDQDGHHDHAVKGPPVPEDR